MKAFVAFSVAVAVPAVMLASPARADQYDFISTLDNNGVYYSSITDMIDLGKAVCRTVRTGGTGASVDQAVFGLTRAGFSSQMERAVIINSAAANMCPDIWPAIYEHNRAITGGPPPPADTPPQFSCENDYCG